MSKALPILVLVLAGGIFGVAQASRRGVGIPEPAKKPVNIREESLHTMRHGHHRTHYFIGGGPHYGK